MISDETDPFSEIFQVSIMWLLLGISLCCLFVCLFVCLLFFFWGGGEKGSLESLLSYFDDLQIN